jgi:mono/diheme cytochrome c family protein
MSRSFRVLRLVGASIAVAGFASACGTEHIKVARSNPLYRGAALFSQRCGGCHTLSYAATHGSAPNTRTAQANNGPNFDVRCERPVARVLYAIENGGFSGAYMPQNVVVGQDAIAVAKFVATYAGRQVPKAIGIVRCQQQPVGSIPASVTPTATAAASSTVASSSSVSSGGGQISVGLPDVKAAAGNPGHRRKKRT